MNARARVKEIYREELVDELYALGQSKAGSGETASKALGIDLFLEVAKAIGGQTGLEELRTLMNSVRRVRMSGRPL